MQNTMTKHTTLSKSILIIIFCTASISTSLRTAIGTQSVKDIIAITAESAVNNWLNTLQVATNIKNLGTSYDTIFKYLKGPSSQQAGETWKIWLHAALSESTSLPLRHIIKRLIDDAIPTTASKLLIPVTSYVTSGFTRYAATRLIEQLSPSAKAAANVATASPSIDAIQYLLFLSMFAAVNAGSSHVANLVIDLVIPQFASSAKQLSKTNPYLESFGKACGCLIGRYMACPSQAFPSTKTTTTTIKDYISEPKNIMYLTCNTLYPYLKPSVDRAYDYAKTYRLRKTSDQNTASDVKSSKNHTVPTAA